MSYSLKISVSSQRARCFTLIDNSDKLKSIFTSVYETFKNKLIQIKYYFRNNKQILYLVPTAFFILSLSGVLAHGLWLNHQERGNFEVMEINDILMGREYSITLTHLAYNPVTGVHQMNVFFDSIGMRQFDFFSHSIEASAIVLSNQTEELQIEIIRITSQYYVLFIHNMPNNFEALRMDITSINDFDERVILHQIRTYEWQSVIDESLKVETDREKLVHYALYTDIRLLEVLMVERADEISQLEQQIVEAEADIEETQIQMRRQVGDNLEASRRRVEGLTNQISSFEANILELEDIISHTQNEINLIQEIINEVS